MMMWLEDRKKNKQQVFRLIGLSSVSSVGNNNNNDNNDNKTKIVLSYPVFCSINNNAYADDDGWKQKTTKKSENCPVLSCSCFTYDYDDDGWKQKQKKRKFPTNPVLITQSEKQKNE